MVSSEHKTEVLVIGAGPAGSSAATVLARAGMAVTLVDRASFPRHKTCGDGLISDSLRAVDELGLSSVIDEQAYITDKLLLFAPSGRRATLNGKFVSVPRRELDAVLCETARESGAHLLTGWRLSGSLSTDGRIGGARFVHPRTRNTLTIKATETVLATGAALDPLRQFGVSTRNKPTAIAVRQYYEVPVKLAAELDFWSVAYEKRILPGYGWIFPGPRRIYNVGTGIPYQPKSKKQRNLRRCWELFTQGFPIARRLIACSRPVGPLQGAPLRTGLEGSRLQRPGLIVIGEAAGLTFAFTGEGIGNAMQSGILAAQILERHRNELDQGNRAEEEYAKRVSDSLRTRFKAYDRAERWLSSSQLCNLLVRRAHPDSYVQRNMEGIISETTDPRAIFSLPGLFRALLS